MAEMSGGRSAENDALQRAADRIEAELICCDVFERLHDKPTKDWTILERTEYHAHSICYWGEAARRIVLDTRLTPPAEPCRECGPGYRIGDEGCRHTPPTVTEEAR